MDAEDEAVSVSYLCRKTLVDISDSIILDEIHSIGQQEGGAVWEQILLMAPCPIMFVPKSLNENGAQPSSAVCRLQ
jgi:hypothetical protein